MTFSIRAIFHLPQPAWPKIQDRRMNSMTPQMFSMHLTCEGQEAA